MKHSGQIVPAILVISGAIMQALPFLAEDIDGKYLGAAMAFIGMIDAILTLYATPDQTNNRS